ncbi:1-deoxy-D-xylulose-5-phosphate synthase [Thiofaba sp. EF100]|uniref:1-deoxy-D-xylulose-5-phosphate synthase n=1 Tax=Thiofaba sp. EF100 TaxID=3121274 RepID=UPI0032214868
MSLLETIHSPADLKGFSTDQLNQLAGELRRFIIDSVSATGGHLAANLGTIELTLALHRVLDLPRDVLVWDVGHQAYAHKILTGRREAMASLRQFGGLSGFTKREESPYDPFGAGHSSTSISAALGFAKAFKLQGLPHQAVAVIGDGALTAGQAFEALNHAGAGKANLLVVLNDNAMSISPNVGALNRHLARLITSRTYNRVREGGKHLLELLPGGELVRRAREQVKGMLTHSALFEELGFRYVGPVDGHDLPTLLEVLANLSTQSGPRLLHVVTQKGRGYAPAEADPVRFHGVGRFNPYKLEPAPGKPAVTFTQVFGDWLCGAAERDARVVGITPAMCEGSGLTDFSLRFPERYFDVGIAEQHAVTFAGGLAAAGLRPVLAIYSTFLQRGYDQAVHDIALQNLPVLFAIDRAGLVGADGATHAGLYDIAFLRCVPNMVIMTPSDEAECHRMLELGLTLEGPSAVRYPRGAGCGVSVPQQAEPLPLGQAVWRRRGRKVAILAFGPLLHEALKAAETIDASVLDMRFVKPLDVDALREAATQHTHLVTLEDHALMGGAGSAVLESLADEAITLPVLRLGLPDVVTVQGTQAELYRHYGLDADGILRQIRAFLA